MVKEYNSRDWQKHFVGKIRCVLKLITLTLHPIRANELLLLKQLNTLIYGKESCYCGVTGKSQNN